MYVSVWFRPDKKVSNEILKTVREASRKYGTYRYLNEWKGPRVTFYTLKVRPARYGKTIDELAPCAGAMTR